MITCVPKWKKEDKTLHFLKRTEYMEKDRADIGDSA